MRAGRNQATAGVQSPQPVASTPCSDTQRLLHDTDVENAHGALSPAPVETYIDSHGHVTSSVPSADVSPGNPKSPLFGCVFNLTNTVLGAGTLSLPFAFAATGWLLGLFILFGVGGLSYTSLRLLQRTVTCQGKRHATFYHLALAAGGTRLALIVDGICFFYLFAAMSAYQVLILDAMDQTIPASWGLHQWLLSFFFSTCILLPLSLRRSFAALKYFSILAVMMVLYVVSLTAAHAMMEASSPATHVLPPTIKGAFEALPIFAFAFSSQIQFVPIQWELVERTERRVTMIAASAITICASIYLCMASSGYHAFGSAVKGNVLLSMPNSGAVTAGHLALAVVLSLSYPLLCSPTRSSAVNIFRHISKASKSTAVASVEELEKVPHFLTTSAIVYGSMVIACSVPGVETLFGIAGAIGGCAVCFILPAIFYNRLCIPVHGKASFDQSAKIKQLGSISLAAFGVVVGIIAVVVWAESLGSSPESGT